MLEAVGLHMGEVGRRPSDGSPDTVVGQFPVAGTPVQPGAPVQIWLAVPRPPTVPDLRGQDRAGAVAALSSARLRLGLIGERHSDDRPGTVVEQSPPAGTVVRPGMPIDVWVAMPRPVEVPAVVGRQESDAVTIVRDRRLRVGDIRYRESAEPPGVVLEQAPEAGRQVSADTDVDLWLAKPRTVLVPDVRGGNQRIAGEALKIVGLVVGDVREREGSAPRGTVMDQLPAPGSQVVAGTSVSLSIAVPAERVVVVPPPPPPPRVQPTAPAPTAPAPQPVVAPVRVPPVVGVPVERAFVLLQNAGLRPGRVSELRATATAGTVTTQFPAAGTDTSPGAQVDLIVAVSMGIAPWLVSPWILALGLGLLITVAGSLMKTRTKTERELPSPSVSFEPHADRGVQSALSADGVLTRSEFRLEGCPDAGIQTLHVADRLVAGET
jgi:beta-lactam-binding protein with PASTA domain